MFTNKSKSMYICNKEIGKALFKCLDIYGAFQETYKDPYQRERKKGRKMAKGKTQKIASV